MDRLEKWFRDQEYRKILRWLDRKNHLKARHLRKLNRMLDKYDW